MSTHYEKDSVPGEPEPSNLIEQVNRLEGRLRNLTRKHDALGVFVGELARRVGVDLPKDTL
jgi:hypothetical protein